MPNPAAETGDAPTPRLTSAAGAQLDCLTAAADHCAATGYAVEAARLRAALDDRGD